jgi:hypothetical protein
LPDRSRWCPAFAGLVRERLPDLWERSHRLAGSLGAVRRLCQGCVTKRLPSAAKSAPAIAARKTPAASDGQASGTRLRNPRISPSEHKMPCRKGPVGAGAGRMTLDAEREDAAQCGRRGCLIAEVGADSRRRQAATTRDLTAIDHRSTMRVSAPTGLRHGAEEGGPANRHQPTALPFVRLPGGTSLCPAAILRARQHYSGPGSTTPGPAALLRARQDYSASGSTTPRPRPRLRALNAWRRPTFRTEFDAPRSGVRLVGRPPRAARACLGMDEQALPVARCV